MKQIFMLPSALFSLLLFSFSYNQKAPFTLTVKVENLRNSNGVVQFALYNKDRTIPDEYFKNCYKIKKGKIIDGKSESTFTNLSEGKYAVNILHDENNNSRIDKSLVMPREGIGFSNYTAISLTNRPSFVKASFRLTTDSTIIVKAIYK